MEGPLEVVDDIIGGVEKGIDSLGSGIVRTTEGVGESVMGALDKPFTGLTGMEGPHRAIDHAARGVIDAGVNFARNGVIGSVKIAGKGIMDALEHPLNQIGKGKFELPKIMQK